MLRYNFVVPLYTPGLFYLLIAICKWGIHNTQLTQFRKAVYHPAILTAFCSHWGWLKKNNYAPLPKPGPFPCRRKSTPKGQWERRTAGKETTDHPSLLPCFSHAYSCTHIQTAHPSVWLRSKHLWWGVLWSQFSLTFQKQPSPMWSWFKGLK